MYEIFLITQPDQSIAVGTNCSAGSFQRQLADGISPDRTRAALSLTAIEQADRLNAIVAALYPDGWTIVHPQTHQN